MKSLSRLTLERTPLAMLVLAPTAACAKPADQIASPPQETATRAGGVMLSTFMSRQEKRMLADDTDGDGKVSRVEFSAAAKGDKGDPAKRFVKFDVNGDGVLSKTEIDAVLSRRFQRLDTNGDGMLSAGERAAAHARKVRDAGDRSEP